MAVFLNQRSDPQAPQHSVSVEVEATHTMRSNFIPRVILPRRPPADGGWLVYCIDKYRYARMLQKNLAHRYTAIASHHKNIKYTQGE